MTSPATGAQRPANHPAVRAAVRSVWAAALSANHLAVFRPPPTLRRLYVAHDNDPAGQRAAQQLGRQAQDAGIEAIMLTPSLKDFNDDLRRLGIDAFRAALRAQLVSEDVSRFMASETGTTR